VKYFQVSLFGGLSSSWGRMADIPVAVSANRRGNNCNFFVMQHMGIFWSPKVGNASYKSVQTFDNILTMRWLLSGGLPLENVTTAGKMTVLSRGHIVNHGRLHRADRCEYLLLPAAPGADQQKLSG
jgi:hypothetical protein